jgi:hypothetical protein
VTWKNKSGHFVSRTEFTFPPGQCHLKPVKAGLIGPLYEMVLAVGRSVIAGDGSVESAADPGRAGATAAAALHL